MTSRGVTTAITLVVLLLLLAVGAFLGWRAISAPVSDEPAADAQERGCARVSRGDRVRTRDVTVSVFNAGDRAGLAGETQERLVERGFVAGDVGNAPASLTQVDVVRVLAPERRDPAALLVAAQFGPNTFVQVTDQDLGAGVDVVVGEDYKGLRKAPRQLTARAAGSGC